MPKQVALVPWSAIPKQPKLITWADTDNTRARIVALLKEGRDYDAISEITRCRTAFVRSVISRYLHPEDYVCESPPKPEPKPKEHKLRVLKKITTNCQQCGNGLQAYPKEIAKGRKKFCSTACYSKSGIRRGKRPG